MDDNQPRDTRIVTEPATSSTSGWLLAIIVIVGLVVAAFALGLVNIDQIRSGKAPTVSVQASGGEAPVFDIQTADIDVGKKQETVKVPTVDVGSEDKAVTVPTISIDRVDNPDKKDK
ncbi:MAG: hypothetical protein H7268_04600 [Sandarakinorhabdus sp.]|nr:hypothetical protein [Sandarakinorhabdus sp.]